MKKLFLALGLLSLAVPADPVHAASKQTMVYDVYASGAHVLESKLEITEKNGAYDIVMNAHTYGFLAMLLPWHGSFETHGWALGKGDYLPEIYKSDTQWKDEYEQKTYTYDRKKGLISFSQHKHETGKKDKNKETVPEPELAKGTVDSLTGALRALAGIAAGKDCSGQSDVYDDKRRFTQVFHPLPAEDLPASPYNVYKGPSVVCTAEVVPAGGDWHKKPRGWLYLQEQGRKAGALPTMWAAKLSETGRPAVPVKFMIKTDYGTLFLHLAEYREGDKIIVAQKRKK